MILLGAAVALTLAVTGGNADDPAPRAAPLVNRAGAGPGLLVFTPASGSFKLEVTWGDPGGLRLGRGIGCTFRAAMSLHGAASFGSLEGADPAGSAAQRFAAPAPGQVELNIEAGCLDDVGAGPLPWTVLITR